MIAALPNHIQKGKYPKNANAFKGEWCEAVFASPSVEYCTFYSSQLSKDKTSKIPIVLFQCRVDPKAIEVHPETIAWSKKEQLCPYYKNDELEWRITDKSKIVVYGILIRELDGNCLKLWEEKKNSKKEKFLTRD